VRRNVSYIRELLLVTKKIKNELKYKHIWRKAFVAGSIVPFDKISGGKKSILHID